MFSKNIIKDINRIELSDEYRNLFAYQNEKVLGWGQTLLDWQKQLLSRWLLSQLKETVTWTNPHVSMILLAAYKVNEHLEINKSNADIWVSACTSEQIQDAQENLKKILDAKVEQLDITGAQATLDVLRTGLVTTSALSEKIVNLYAKMKNVQSLRDVMSTGARASASVVEEKGTQTEIDVSENRSPVSFSRSPVSYIS